MIKCKKLKLNKIQEKLQFSYKLFFFAQLRIFCTRCLQSNCNRKCNFMQSGMTVLIWGNHVRFTMCDFYLQLSHSINKRAISVCPQGHLSEIKQVTTSFQYSYLSQKILELINLLIHKKNVQNNVFFNYEKCQFGGQLHENLKC